MTSISRQLELPYSTAQMYALVNDVARYPEFVPFCKSALIHEQTSTFMKACLGVEWQGIKTSFTTQNKLIENQSITLHLVQGVIKNLTGEWQFIPKGEHASAVKISVNIEFKNHFTGLLFGAAAQQVLNRITDAFCQRAVFLYGSNDKN